MKTLIILITLLPCSLHARDYTDLSWVGSLNLPKAQRYQKNLSNKIEQPNLWKTWKPDSDFKVTWLPTKKMKKSPLINVKIINLSKISNKNLNRKEKRALKK